MGGASSKAARVASRVAVTNTAASLKKTVTPSQKPYPKPALPKDPHITARVNPTQAPEYHRQTTEEWSETLKKISGAISSSRWEGEVEGGSQEGMKRDEHPAQRSRGTNLKLPTRRDDSENASQLADDGMHSKPKGRVTQTEMLELFNLRRENPKLWTASALASKYGISEEDASDLLAFSRTYNARMDSDGQVRGYYNVDPENTITRFEKD